MATTNQEPSYRRIRVNAGQLRDWYITQRLSQKDIAAKLGCHQAAVHYQLKKHGIVSRTKSAAQLSRNDRCPPVRGPSHRHYKTGRNSAGYAVTCVRGRSIKVHRLVAEELLGRHLLRREAVHHVNGIKDDNRPDNLWVFPTNVDHRAFHHNGTIHPDTIFLKDHTA